MLAAAMAAKGTAGNIPSAGYACEDVAQATVSSGSGDACCSKRLGQRQRLVDLIQLHGAFREDRRYNEIEELQRAREAERQERELSTASASSEPTASQKFSADLVHCEAETGFELWLGSLEDALNLEALRERDISGVLNCAVEECQRECAPFRCQASPDDQMPQRRRRTHARGPSLADDGEAATQRRALPADVVRGLVEFDTFWYSMMCDTDVAYLGFDGEDKENYRMDTHFEEVQMFLEECRQEHRKVLIHCIMGINRSAAALVSFLCSGLGMEVGEAVSLTSKRRGYILSNTSFLDQLVECYAKAEESEEVHDKLKGSTEC